MRNDTAKEQMQLVEDCESRESNLSNWEATEFIPSIRRQLEEGVTLSGKQNSLLEEVWEHVTSKG